MMGHMRRPRFKAPEHFESAIYHCVSRVVDRRKVLGPQEKEHFVRLMRLYERLYGLRIVTYCVMGNHFHILVEVPRRPETLPTDQALVALVAETKGREEAFWLEHWLTHWRREGNHAAAEAERERWFRQMWDISQFMKVLKQRFSQWFNARQSGRRKGTLWEERFRSVLVEDGRALHAMAAYIDLNPLRAGLVKDPADYRWSGYGEAAAGQKAGMSGLNRLAENLRREGVAMEGGLLAWYREQLMGREARRNGAQGPEQGEKVPAHDGGAGRERDAAGSAGKASPLGDSLRRRVRYFTDGAALGSREFINAVFEARRGWFSARRRTGARTLKGFGRASPLQSLRSLRDLQKFTDGRGAADPPQV